MNENLLQLLQALPLYLTGHIQVTMAALVTGLMLVVPMGLLSIKSPRSRWALMTVGGLFHTIPSIAMLALMVPLLGRIGFWPAYVALTLCSFLPMLRSTLKGLSEVNADVLEAAQGLGMTQQQILWRVQVPLALPDLLSGIRFSTVLVVGAATLSTPIGWDSLGNYIFTGLQTSNKLSIVMGCLFSAALAISLDQSIGLFRSGLKRRRVVSVSLGLASFLAIMASPLVVSVAVPGAASRSIPSEGTASSADSTVVKPRNDSLAGRPIVIGGKPFTEQYILTELMALQLDGAGYEVSRKPNLGSSVLFEAIGRGTVDCYVDYSGTLWSSLFRNDPPASSEIANIRISHGLLESKGVVVLGALGFKNDYCLAMRREHAEQLGVSRISDLERVTSRLMLGADYEFFGRKEWGRVRSLYNVESLRTKSLDPALMYQALKSQEVDIITAYTSDGRIVSFDLIVLEDDRAAFPHYDAVILLSAAAARDAELVNALRPLVNSLNIATMQEANNLVDSGDATPAQAAERILSRGGSRRVTSANEPRPASSR